MAKKRFNNRPPMPPVPPVPPVPPDKPHFHFPHRHWKPNNHNADFAPMLLHPHIPHHFNFWCNKIIPLAYDDSLSYYEVLAKTTDYLNNMLNDEKMLAINVEELAQCFCELQHFVNDYFSFYQSKGLIVYDFAITSENYEKYLPDADTAQMNTLYRIKFVEGAEQNITANLPEAAKPYSGAECLLFNVSNFDLRRYGNQWQEIPPTENGYTTKENYQLFITDKDIFFRENNGDTWGGWNSIFANWWESTYADVQAWVRALVQDVSDTLNAKIDAEIARATAAEQALDSKIDTETNRATAAENALSSRLVAEYERASAAEQALDDKIDDETTRATTAENSLSNALTVETTRATTAENALSADITTENSRATTAENALSSRIADWETDLADEREDRTQGDNTLNNKITAEVNRATTAEQTLDGKIDAETTRATAAEQAIRDGYIPNLGNNAAGDLVITRDSHTIKATDDEVKLWNDNPNGESPTLSVNTHGVSMSNNVDTGMNVGGDDETQINLYTYNNSIEIGYGDNSDEIWFNSNGGKVYYQNGTYSADADMEIVVKGDLSGVMSGYIPNAGNTLSGDLNIGRNGTIILTGGTNTAHRKHLDLNWGGGLVLGDSFLYDILFINKSWVKLKGDNFEYTGGEVYFYNNGSVTINPRGNVTINPNGSVSVKGYIPNGGNTTNDSFALTRNSFNIVGTAGACNIISVSDLGIQSSADLNVQGVGVMTLQSAGLVKLKSTSSAVDIDAANGVTINPTGDVTINPSGNVSVKGYIPNSGNSTNGNFDLSRAEIRLKSSNGYFTVEDISAQAPEYFALKLNTAARTPNSYEFYLFNEVGYPTLKVDRFMVDCPNAFHAFNQSNQFSACLLNQDVAQSNISQNITIDEGNLYSEMKWNCCGFVFSNNAVLALSGGRMSFENCVFSGTGSINLSEDTNSNYLTFTNCEFSVPVSFTTASKVIFKNCRFNTLTFNGYDGSNTYGNHIIDGCFINTLTIDTDPNTADPITMVNISNNRIITKTITGLGDITNEYFFNNHVGAI